MSCLVYITRGEGVGGEGVRREGVGGEGVGERECGEREWGEQQRFMGQFLPFPNETLANVENSKLGHQDTSLCVRYDSEIFLWLAFSLVA